MTGSRTQNGARWSTLAHQGEHAGTDELRMNYVPGTTEVKTGDLVVTSGIDGIYPRGFVIGTVESVERGPGTYHEIRVRPAVDFARLEEVLVVLTPPPGRDAAKDQP